MKASLNTESCRVNIAIFQPRIEMIQEVVADHYGLPVEKTKEHCRKGESIKARQYIHYFCKELLCREGMPLKCSLSVVGLLTGNGRAWDHSTIYHSHKIITATLTFKNRAGVLVYPEVLAEITQLRDKILQRFEAARAEPSVKRCSCCGQIIPG